MPGVLALIVFLATTLIGLLFCLMLFWPTSTPFVWHSLNVNSPQKAGTYMEYDVNYCKNTNNKGVIERSLVGVGSTNGGYVAPEIPGIIQKGCGTAHISLYIPSTVPSGTYTLFISASFPVNKLRSEAFSEVSNTFTILPA